MTQFHRPALVYPKHAISIDASISRHQIKTWLKEKRQLIIQDSYQTGAEALSIANRILPNPSPKSSYAQRKAYEQEMREIAKLILAPIKHHKLHLEGARDIGFLQELYPPTLQARKRAS